MTPAMVETMTKLLDGLLTPENLPNVSDKEAYEAQFQYACVWAFGGHLAADKVADHIDGGQ